jgi:hypothetical protein
LTIRRNDGSEAIAVFHDQDAAQKCLDSCPFPDEYTLFPVNESLTFLGLLVVLEEKGFTHVVFDSTATEAAVTGVVLPVATIRDTLLKRF